MLRPRLLLLAAALLLGCAAPAETPAPAPVARAPFSVARRFIRDPEGRALTLRGMNLSGRHKWAPYFDFHGPDDFARLRRDWGMNAVRLLLSWAAIEPAEGVFDPTYLDAVEERVAWAREAGLFVVLDMHQDVYGEGFAGGGGDGAPRWTCAHASYESFVPNPSQWFLNYLTPEVSGCYDHLWKSEALRAHYQEAWRRVARRLGSHDDVVVGFDPMNEPYAGTYAIDGFEADVLQPFYEDVIAAVRAERPGWLAFVEPASSRNLGYPTRLQKLSVDGVVYAPHAYDAAAEAGQGFDAAHREALLELLRALAQEAAKLEAPLWVGEYGGRAEHPGIVDYMTAEYDGVSEVAGGSMYWDYGKGGYGVLAEDGSEKAELVGALVRPWPERVAGDPIGWEYVASTRTFTLRFEVAPSVSAPTVVVVPARVYPDGVTVACGGCTVREGTGTVELSGFAAGPAGVTITPK